MNSWQRSNQILGLVVLTAALLLIFVWIPIDIETGIVEKQRRRMVIGDSFAPTIAGVFVLLSAIGLLLLERKAPNQPHIQRQNLRFIVSIVLIITSGLLVIRYFGPLAVLTYNKINHSELQYRLLRDSYPWKYLGFLTGGTLLISGLIWQVQGKFSWTAVAVAALAIMLMIAIYDLPFDDLLLPPNGDV